MNCSKNKRKVSRMLNKVKAASIAVVVDIDEKKQLGL
jgi:hypothetical protein